MRVPQRTMTDLTVAGTGLGTWYAIWTQYIEPLAQMWLVLGTGLLILLRLALGVREIFHPHPKRKKEED
jgi:hypothetical protein